MNGFLFFLGGIISGSIIYLIRSVEKGKKLDNKSKELNQPKANLTQKNPKVLEIRNENFKAESTDPVLNGEFLTDDILDRKFKEIALYNLDLIKAKNSPDELNKVKFKKLPKLIESLDRFQPKSESRDDRKLLIQYLKKINRRINSISYRELLELENNYVSPIVDNKDKYGWQYKRAWLAGLALLLPIEVIIWIIINLILRIFIDSGFYFLPVLTTYYLVKCFIDQKKLKAAEKLW